MAILPMEQITICAMRKNRKPMMELLQRRGTVEISSIAVQDEVFGKSDTSANRLLFEKNAEVAAKAVEIINRYNEEKKPMLAFLHGREEIALPVADSFYKKSDTVLKVAQRVLQLDKDKKDAQTQLARIEAQREALSHWQNLPVPQTFKGTKKTTVFVGAIEGKHTAQELEKQLAEVAPELEALHIEVVLATKEQTTLYAIALKKQATEAETALRAIGFARPASPTHHPPAKKMQQLEEQKKQAEQTIEDATEEIISYGPRREDIRFLEDHLTMRAEKYGMIDRLMQSKHVFMLQGYIPAEAAPALQAELEETFTCNVQIKPVEETDEPPVKLHNNRFSEPTESIVESYSMPAKTDIDPTGVMAFFYYAMFGLMFGDAGYGLIMVVVCGICLLRFKNMEPNWNKNIRMFFWCGVFTTFWGVVFSSYFGNVVNVVSKTFFGQEVGIPPILFYIEEKPMLMLVICLGIGIIHLTAGYIMKAATNLKNGDKAGVLYDTVFPIMAWYPLVLVLAGSDMFGNLAGFKLSLPPLVSPICFAITGAAVLGIVLTAGRGSRNWFIRILKGIYEVYSILSGWLSDTLSYSRLLALGLASGVIASVMNELGSMAGGGIPGIIVFVLVFAAGQTMNFGINVLGAYVHSNRLEYIEFFGKFYEGGGRKFTPFAVHTKHYKIGEE
ncbi:V-type ATP synthase subunit I [Ruminococcaceae bacterium OttesenSCG-928-A16]|nr:V-type ATP synthase subunit I [Ruminococcaceae bacterium OttesenSCG-928-A16]